MSTDDIIIGLYVRGDSMISTLPKHPLDCGLGLRQCDVADNAFHQLIADFQDEMVILTDMAFHRKDGDPPNRMSSQRYHAPTVVTTSIVAHVASRYGA